MLADRGALRATDAGRGCPPAGARAGRADAGILKHTQRVWASDCNDALTRIGIQSGFLRFLPPDGQRKLHHRIAVFLAGYWLFDRLRDSFAEVV